MAENHLTGCKPSCTTSDSSFPSERIKQRHAKITYEKVITNECSASNRLSTHLTSLNLIVLKDYSADLVKLLYSLTYNNNNTNDFVNRQIAIAKEKTYL